MITQCFMINLDYNTNYIIEILFRFFYCGINKSKDFHDSSPVIIRYVQYAIAISTKLRRCEFYIRVERSLETELIINIARHYCHMPWIFLEKSFSIYFNYPGAAPLNDTVFAFSPLRARKLAIGPFFNLT